MPSVPPNWIGSRVRLVIAAGLLGLTSIMPGRMLGWASWLADPVQAVVAPWQHMLGRTAAWARGGRGGGGAQGPGETDPVERAARAELIRQRDEAQFALVQANAQIEELRKRIAEVARGLDLNNLPVVPVVAPVIGGAADLSSRAITVRAGSDQGIEVNNVAVVGGVHIVGVVKRVASRTCVVLPITDRSAGIIAARIMLGDSTPGPMCHLQPDGRGRLSGLVEDDRRFVDSSGRAVEVPVGARVRLYDLAWPMSAHGLIVGSVVSAEPVPDSPLRTRVTVAPIEPIERVREVTIRTLAGEQPAAEAGAGKAGGSP